ncbi:MAG: hypothetical protein K6V36_08790 [Anaerolineae bacterium]|nr:hypothetical protein [Anaerolineae bacterium]
MERIVRWCLLGVLGAVLLPAPFALAAPRTGATLVFARQEETETLDPHKTTTISSAEVDYLIYDTLTSLDYDNTVKPGLAEKWDISPDGKTYTFTLRQGVRFHSGKPLTSADVKFTFDRWKTVRGSPTAFNIAPVESVETPNPRTVVLRLKEPFSILLINLAGYAASILNQEFTQRLGDDYGTGAGKVDGTGPFILDDRKASQSITLAKNEDYWGDTALLDTVEFRVIPDESSIVSAMPGTGWL